MGNRHNFGDIPKEGGLGSKIHERGKDIFFGLADELSEINYLKPDDEIMAQNGNFLQKLHLRNHEITANETVHKFDQDESEPFENASDSLCEEDNYLISDVQLAIAEQDIIDLRANLKSILKAGSINSWSSEDLEKYTDDPDMLKQEPILNDLHADNSLTKDICFYREIDEAISERDIMELRSKFGSIIKFESSHARTVVEIEDYLSGEMEESLVNGFDDDLKKNNSLQADVKLFNEINEAIGERDVMKLRAELQTIRKQDIEPERVQKRGILSLKLGNSMWIAAAASIILLIGLKFIWRNHTYTNNELFSEYYIPVNSSQGVTRSQTGNEVSILNQALTKMNIKDYNSSLKLFSDILMHDSQNVVANFYTGVIFQLQGKCDSATAWYSKVISQGDNLFVEQSDWYLGLCFLSLDQRDKAISQFKKISRENGYYRQKSFAILKKLEQD